MLKLATMTMGFSPSWSLAERSPSGAMALVSRGFFMLSLICMLLSQTLHLSEADLMTEQIAKAQYEGQWNPPEDDSLARNDCSTPLDKADR